MKKNIRRNQQGFTLIELLVVIAILAVMFGITALALNGVGSNAEQVTACGEKDAVQTSLDVYMTQAVTTTIGVGGPAIITAGAPPAGAYLRRDTKYQYSWGTDGKVGSVVTNTTTNKTFTCP